jgi:hypothetical protein
VPAKAFPVSRFHMAKSMCGDGNSTVWVTIK